MRGWRGVPGRETILGEPLPDVLGMCAEAGPMPELEKFCVPEPCAGVKKIGGVLCWLMSCVLSNESLRVLSAVGSDPVFTGSLRTNKSVDTGMYDGNPPLNLLRVL